MLLKNAFLCFFLRATIGKVMLIQVTYCVSLLKVQSFYHLRCVHILLHVAFLEVSLMIIFVIIYTIYMYNIYNTLYHIYVLYICNIRGVSGKYPAIWISREPFAWPWYNLAAGQRRLYCASVNSHSPVGLVSRQWDASDRACVLCERRIHNDRASSSSSSRQRPWPFYSSHAGVFLNHHFIHVYQTPYSPDLTPCDFSQS
jgi:hypothetical protein